VDGRDILGESAMSEGERQEQQAAGKKPVVVFSGNL
jgi:hypothetical protein